jgi:transcriptional regulator with XRE-family HTH domain
MLLTRLKYWRELRGYSLRELADKSKIPYSAISLLENGKREPQGRTARKLAAALEVELTALYEQVPAPVLNVQHQPASNDNKTIIAATTRPRKRPAGISFWVMENDPDQVEPFRLDTLQEAQRLAGRLGQGRARIYEAESKIQVWAEHRSFLVRVTRGQDHW